jgi:hypothetical protein
MGKQKLIIGFLTICLVIVGCSPRKKTPTSPDKNNGTGAISGVIKDKNSGILIDWATVTIGKKTAITGKDGRYSFENLPCGKYTIKVTSPLYRDFAKTIEIEPGAIKFDINLEFCIPAPRYPAKKVVLCGRVIDDETGQLLSPIRLKYRCEYQTGESHKVEASFPGSCYQIDDHKPLSPNGEQVVLEISVPGYNSVEKRFTIYGGKVNICHFSLTPATQNFLKGKVTNKSDGKPLENYYVVLVSSPTAQKDSSYTTRINKEGNYIVKGLKLGTYALIVTKTLSPEIPEISMIKYYAKEGLTIKEGENIFNCQPDLLPEPHTVGKVTIRFLNKNTGQLISAQRSFLVIIRCGGPRSDEYIAVSGTSCPESTWLLPCGPATITCQSAETELEKEVKVNKEIVIGEQIWEIKVSFKD